MDPSFSIQLNNDLLFIERQTPVSTTPFGTSQYVVPRTAIAANQGAKVSFNVAVQSLSSELWSTLGVGAVGSRTIATVVRCQGLLSGLSSDLTITIREEFQRS